VECLQNSVLSPLNFYVDMSNESMFERLPNEQCTHYARISTLSYLRPTLTYYSFDTIKEDETPVPSDHPAATMDFLSLQRQNSILAHRLCLKERCINTILRNLDINDALVKNRQVSVERLNERVIEIFLIDTSSP